MFLCVFLYASHSSIHTSLITASFGSQALFALNGVVTDLVNVKNQKGFSKG
jgi:hypothetical protein